MIRLFWFSMNLTTCSTQFVQNVSSSSQVKWVITEEEKTAQKTDYILELSRSYIHRRVSANHHLRFSFTKAAIEKQCF